MRTNQLREVIKDKLEHLRDNFPEIKSDGIAYGQVSTSVMYPHVVYDFSDMDPMDMGREDLTLDVHVWTKDRAQSFDIIDEVVDLLSFSNDPQPYILPTFYFTSAGTIDDPDKSICHAVVRFQVQNYRRV